MMNIRTCKKCGISKPLEKFPLIGGAAIGYRRHSCNACHYGIRKGNPEYLKAQRAYVKARRTKPEYRAGFILRDLRQGDKKCQRANDLDLEFVRDLLKKGCSYCGENQYNVKMSLDRINNSLGHIKSNVLPSCDNCNLTRGTMPYEAWLLVAKTIRKARKLGLLAGWNRRAGSRSKPLPRSVAIAHRSLKPSGLV